MTEYRQIVIYILIFIWVLFASDYFAKLFRKTRLPLITGFLLSGIICGPHVLNLIEAEALDNLGFINDIALAFIAFAAGAELYLKEIRYHGKSIIWNSVGQLLVTFFAGSVSVYLLADYIPFMQQMPVGSKISVAILMATIFITSSPSSAIAVINELRAKGRFSQTAIGVKVIKDVLVIVLFAISLSLSVTIISGTSFSVLKILVLVFELGVAVVAGYLAGKLITLVLSFRMKLTLKTILVLAIGYGIFLFSHYTGSYSASLLKVNVHVEPLLSAIVASFIVTNYSQHRPEFRKMVDDTGPMVYAAFFTLVGAMMSVDILIRVWFIALVLFMVRLLALILGAWIAAIMAGDPPVYKRISWMAYVTQAGVGLGLVTEVAGEFDAWGTEFATIIIAVIVLNQMVGPPLFKWAINYMKESRLRGTTPEFDGTRDAYIFGLEDQSLALARQLQLNDWSARIISKKTREEIDEISDVPVTLIRSLDMEMIHEIEARKADAMVLMLSDEENLRLAELIYQECGTREIIVRLNSHTYYRKFREIGALIVEPATAMVGLLDHFVRAPIAASLLLGMEENKDSEDFEVRDKQLHGVPIRDLKLPPDILIVSVKRKGQMIVTHGYTRLRKKDVITAVGSLESLEKLRLQFSG